MIVRLLSYEPDFPKRHFAFAQHAIIGNYVGNRKLRSGWERVIGDTENRPEIGSLVRFSTEHRRWRKNRCARSALYRRANLPPKGCGNRRSGAISPSSNDRKTLGCNGSYVLRPMTAAASKELLTGFLSIGLGGRFG